MRPVDKGPCPATFRDYSDAKPYLIDRLGPFCSYCERRKDPQELHVEHIYPKAKTAHPKLQRNWRNFLLACSSCDSYKGQYLGDGRQRGLLKRHLWPHIDNTFSAFVYHADGRVEPTASLGPHEMALAKSTLNMCGMLKSPANADRYRALGVAYDGVAKREEAWGMAKIALDLYQVDPSASTLKKVIRIFMASGHFSVWMRVFSVYSNVRVEIRKHSKASTACFDGAGNPKRRGRV